jgi:hypothetical protein
MNNSETVVKSWLDGMTIAQVSYAAGFLIRLERDSEIESLPNVIILDVKSNMVFGTEDKWAEFISTLPAKAIRGEKDYPALALKLYISIGSKFDAVDIVGNGTLKISTSDCEIIYIQGIESTFDESWCLYIPSDVPFANVNRAIVCSNEGCISVQPSI